MTGAVVLLVAAAVLVAVGLHSVWAPLVAVPGVALAVLALLADWERS